MKPASDAVDLGCAFEEERHRHAQRLGNLLQAAGADPVRALLVLLDLLERDAEGVPETFLAHPDHHAAHPDAGTDVLVDGIR